MVRQLKIAVANTRDGVFRWVYGFTYPRPGTMDGRAVDLPLPASLAAPGDSVRVLATCIDVEGRWLPRECERIVGYRVPPMVVSDR